MEKKLTLEDIERIKADLEGGMDKEGWKINEWGDAKGGKKEPKIVSEQKKLLAKVKVLLDMQLQQDRLKVKELQETVKRMKHGGGS